MPSPIRSSSRRYREYRSELKTRRQDPASRREDAAVSWHGTNDERKSKKRTRSFFKLVGQFWGLLEGHRRSLFLALGALAISTLLSLIPLYGTKIVFDSVLRENPLPVQLPVAVDVHLPQLSRRELLTLVA